jgi:hypothetical protein
MSLGTTLCVTFWIVPNIPWETDMIVLFMMMGELRLQGFLN